MLWEVPAVLGTAAPEGGIAASFSRLGPVDPGCGFVTCAGRRG
jgi:hypothetical protein